MRKPNNILEFEVKDALDWDPVIDDTRVIVRANDGRVTLTGTVPSFYDATLASDDAWSVGGVVDVDNELLVGLIDLHHRPVGCSHLERPAPLVVNDASVGRKAG